LDELALGVVGRRGGAEPDRRVVVLVGADDVREQLGRAADAEHEHARGHRVERAGVADLARAREASGASDDVVARPPARLVDDDQAVGRGRPTRGTVARALGTRAHRASPAAARPGPSDGSTVHRTSTASTGSSSAWAGAWTANSVLSSMPRATKSRASSSLAPARVRYRSNARASTSRARVPSTGSEPSTNPCMRTRSWSGSAMSRVYASPIAAFAPGPGGTASNRATISLATRSNTSRNSSSLVPNSRTT